MTARAAPSMCLLQSCLPTVLCLTFVTVISSLYFSRFFSSSSSDDTQLLGLEKADDDDKDTAAAAAVDNTTDDGASGGRMTLEQEMIQRGGTLTVAPIGVVRSIYRLCVGTPRQGLLCPQARGRIELLTTFAGNAEDAVEGLQGFSHIWILFVFHLNTVSKNRRIPSKIAPPALGGRKLGVLATRSPHRFNPIGMTLAKLDRIERIQRRKGCSTVCLYVSGLDLVDGTPVVDIKPYVPIYDAPIDDCATAAIPPWVSDGLATKRTVHVSDHARQQLQTLLQENPGALEFYGPPMDESVQDCLTSALACIQQVLSMDVRSAFQTKKARQGNYKAERAQRLAGAAVALNNDNDESNHTDNNDNVASSSLVQQEECTQQIDNLLIHYTVSPALDVARSSSEGSGAEDQVEVTAIHELHRLKS